MKIFKYLAIFALIAIQSKALEIEALGFERIKPLKHPKAQLLYDYGFNRKVSFLTGKYHNLSSKSTVGIGFEMNSLKYLNLGANFTIVMSNILANDLSPSRFTLFLKPFIPFGDNFSIYSKVQAGPAVALLYAFGNKDEEVNKSATEEFGGPMAHNQIGFGGSSYVALGFDAFIFSRLGFFAEVGIRNDIYFYRVNKEIKKMMPETTIASKLRKYWIFDLPVLFGMNIIF